MLKKRKFELYSLVILFAATLTFATAQVNLLTKASFGDWAEYSVTRENKTIPLMSFKDQKRWRIISTVDDSHVRIDEGGRAEGADILIRTVLLGGFPQPVIDPVFVRARKIHPLDPELFVLAGNSGG